MSTRVKICGITRPEDAALAAELGTDFVGINLIAGPRKVDREMTLKIMTAVRHRATPVCLVTIQAEKPSRPPSTLRVYTDEYDASIADTPVASLRPSTLQVYEAPRGACPMRGRNATWLVRHVGSRQSLTELAEECRTWQTEVTIGCFGVGAAKPDAFLLDTSVNGSLGGTGQSFNWHWIAEARDAGELDGLPPIILAGGLTPDNVAEAIRIAKPYAVDVSSGVEIPNQPGIKDKIKMRDFIQAAKQSDH
jgi:phosphoribosylanthranilate isomerase